MKRILITGVDSYIGTSVADWLARDPGKYRVDTVDMRDDAWREKDFTGYDVIFHVAGLAHISSDPGKEELYYRVNRDLAIQTAVKAKDEGVKQFIFMSSIIVYGAVKGGVIDENTVPLPGNFYGNSKLQAEKGLKDLESDSFKVTILRPPMIYGKGSKGNYPKLSKAAQKMPLFPDLDNRRSMLHIDNLCAFIKALIDHEEGGLFFPQNREYVKTSEMARLIAEAYGKKLRLTGLFNPLLKLMRRRVGIVEKVFGNLVYEQSMSEYRVNYRIRNLRESIELTER
ncbi:MAG: NAD-dependent epimerase/dehydratase family protein [Firmicutes bacterium]|nr:NAD-dependent epimerase/dehydratase family protein [Bacillota bacterium]